MPNPDFYRTAIIDNSSDILTPDEQYQYSSILRSTLSRYELVWLFYNGLSEYGQDKLKPLIEKYCMLKNLRTDLLTLCKDNLVILTQNGKSIEAIRQAGFELSDYLFFTTYQRGVIDKYHISAFKRKNEIQAVAEYLHRWNEYLSTEI